MKVLITGANGQVGRALIKTAPAEFSIEALTHAQLDLTKSDHVADNFVRVQPKIVINAAAYTAVDKAESERELAQKINGDGVAILASHCKIVNARLVHVSTDYVFDGQSSVAYETNSPTNPINAYGATKLAGEQALQRMERLDYTIVRTSWVYAPWGNNFLFTMLRLMRERGAVSVVCDQIGAPTSALSLARFLWQTANASANGLLHYTDAGIASWYDFAVAINEEATALGLLKTPATVTPTQTAEFPTAAKRPKMSLLATNSSLQKVACSQPHWREALRQVLKELRSAAT